MKEGNRKIIDVSENRKAEILESIVNICINEKEDHIFDKIIEILIKNDLIKRQ